MHALDKNPENAILVKTFFGENDDNELPKILDFLLFLKDVNNFLLIS